MDKAKSTEPTGTSRFQIIGRLGQGGMGVVYRAFDRERGSEVALKTLATADADSIYRLKREFRSLAELSHPNLCSLHELFFENGTWFFTMELVKGFSFTQYVWRQDTRQEEEPTRPPLRPSHDTGSVEVRLDDTTERGGGAAVRQELLAETRVRPPPPSAPLGDQTQPAQLRRRTGPQASDAVTRFRPQAPSPPEASAPLPQTRLRPGAEAYSAPPIPDELLPPTRHLPGPPPPLEVTRHSPPQIQHFSRGADVVPPPPPPEALGTGTLHYGGRPTPVPTSAPTGEEEALGTETAVYGLGSKAPAPTSVPILLTDQLGTGTLHFGGGTSPSPAPAATPVPAQAAKAPAPVSIFAPPPPPGNGGTHPPAAREHLTPQLPSVAPLVRKRPQYDPQRLVASLKQLVRGVHHLHQCGKQHRDLKPANVMVAEDGRVVLLDFGLAMEKPDGLLGDDLEDHASGTPAYMAPERHAGKPSTEASDWYSVGVMLYEALTGRRPYTHLSVFQGQPVSPPSPKDLVPDLPDQMVDLCLRLLAWEPSRRPNGPEILRALGEEAGPAAPSPSAASAGTVFVGRELHLKSLQDAFGLLQTMGPVLVKVQGTSGFGKTALVRHFLGQLHESHQAVVLAGRCYERESMPYKVFDSLIDSLTRYLNTIPRNDAATLMPRDIHVLAKLFPALMRVDAVVNAPRRNVESRDAHELARRASAALKEMLGRIADRSPLVLFVDDLHWGDLDSARLLGDLVVQPDPPRTLLVVSYRSEELESNKVLHTLLESAQAEGSEVLVRELMVGPMNAEESRQLAVKVLGATTAAGAAPAAAIIKEAAGSPFFVTELARYLSTPGLAQPGATLGVSLNDVLKARIERLPDNARQLLQAVAVAGRPMQQQLAVQSAGLSTRSEEAVYALRAASLVRLSGPRVTDTVEVYHDRIRETVVGGLPAEKLSQQHRAIATVLERVEPLDAEALTTHWQAAGEPLKAGRYAVIAAYRAAEALAFDRAAQLYQLALRLLAPNDPQRHEAQVELAHALKNAGRGADSARAYLEAGMGAVSEHERLELQRLAMEQFLVSGYVEEGRAVAHAVLEAVGLTMPSTPGGVVLSLLQERAKVRLRGLRFKERAETDVPPSLLDRIDTCAAMSNGLSVIDTKMGSDFSARFLRFALNGGEIGRIARGMVMEAAHQCTGGDFKRADMLVGLAELLARRSTSDHVKGFVQLMSGWVEYFKGHYRNALNCFERSSLVFREKCTGANWEISTANMMSNWSLGYLGEWAELARRGPELLVEAEHSGNLYRMDGLFISHRVMAGLGADEPERVRQQMKEAAERWTPPGFQVQHYFRVLMRGFVDLYAGDAASYWEHLNEQWPALRGSLLLTVEDIRFRMMFIRGFAALAVGDEPKLRRAAKGAASAMKKIHAVGAAGIGDVITAALAHREGKNELAAERLHRASLDFDRAEMTLFAAAARWRQGQLRGGRAGQELEATARRVMAAQQIRRPERVLRMYAPGFPEP